LPAADRRAITRSAMSLAMAKSYSVEEMATSTRCVAVAPISDTLPEASNEKGPCVVAGPWSTGLVGAALRVSFASESYHEDSYISTRDAVSPSPVESCGRIRLFGRWLGMRHPAG